jgi:hypothetical protein
LDQGKHYHDARWQPHVGQSVSPAVEHKILRFASLQQELDQSICNKPIQMREIYLACDLTRYVTIFPVRSVTNGSVAAMRKSRYSVELSLTEQNPEKTIDTRKDIFWSLSASIIVMRHEGRTYTISYFFL